MKLLQEFEGGEKKPSHGRGGLGRLLFVATLA